MEQNTVPMKTIQLSCMGYIKMLLFQHLPDIISYCAYNPMEKAYLKAVEKLDQESDVVKILRDLRTLKMAIRQLLPKDAYKNLQRQ